MSRQIFVNLLDDPSRIKGRKFSLRYSVGFERFRTDTRGC
jgi:hypothetical protein